MFEVSRRQQTVVGSDSACVSALRAELGDSGPLCVPAQTSMHSGSHSRVWVPLSSRRLRMRMKRSVSQSCSAWEPAVSGQPAPSGVAAHGGSLPGHTAPRSSSLQVDTPERPLLGRAGALRGTAFGHLGVEVVGAGRNPLRSQLGWPERPGAAEAHKAHWGHWEQ